MAIGPAAALALALWTAALWLAYRTNVWAVTGAAAALVLLLCALSGRRLLAPLLRPRARDLALGAALGLAMAAASHLLYPPAAARLPGIAAEVARLYGRLHDPPGPLAALPVLALVVAAEEVLFRGLIYGLLARGPGAALPVLGSALLYALPQLATGSPLLVGLSLGCGLLWGAERALTRGLLAPALTHLLWDALVFLALPLAAP